jgi:phosphoglycolate phosphatase
MLAFEKVFATEFGRPGGSRGIKFSGRTDPSIVREFFLQQGFEPNARNFQRFFERYVFWLPEVLESMEGRVLPGVLDLIARLKAAPVPPLIGLLTGNIRLGAEIKLRHYQLWEHFETGAFGDDHEDRNELARVARERGGHLLGQPLAGSEIVVIGDTPRDIECGRAIEARCLAVATGGATWEELEAHRPDWLVKTLAEFNPDALLA